MTQTLTLKLTAPATWLQEVKCRWECDNCCWHWIFGWYSPSLWLQQVSVLCVQCCALCKKEGITFLFFICSSFGFPFTPAYFFKTCASSFFVVSPVLLALCCSSAFFFSICQHVVWWLSTILAAWFWASVGQKVLKTTMSLSCRCSTAVVG